MPAGLIDNAVALLQQIIAKMLKNMTNKLTGTKDALLRMIDLNWQTWMVDSPCMETMTKWLFTSKDWIKRIPDAHLSDLKHRGAHAITSICPISSPPPTAPRVTCFHVRSFRLFCVCRKDI